MTSIKPPAKTEPDNIPVIADPDAGSFCLSGCHELPDTDCRLRACQSPKEALEWGFIPCSACRPMDVAGRGDALKLLMDDIAANPEFSIKAGGVLDRNLDPDCLRRDYQKQYGLSFQDYLRMRRINLRFGNSKRGNESVTEDDVVFTRLGTPLGPMLAAATGRGLCLLEFAERRMMETQIKRLEKYHSGRLLMGERESLSELAGELNEYFSGTRREFNVPLDLKGTPFQLSVWEELQSISYGEARSYGEQARALGDIRKVRAVAGANGDNPVSIVVPCHRVLGADGTMTGYGGRIWRKEALLRLESDQGELF